MDKEERITKEARKLKRIFKELPQSKTDIAEKLISNAAFMAATLEDLQEAIDQAGFASTYRNSETQWGVKKSPEVELYNAMIRNYATVIKQLLDLLPKEEAKQEENEFINFLQRKVK